MYWLNNNYRAKAGEISLKKLNESQAKVCEAAWNGRLVVFLRCVNIWLASEYVTLGRK